MAVGDETRLIMRRGAGQVPWRGALIFLRSSRELFLLVFWAIPCGPGKFPATPGRIPWSPAKNSLIGHSGISRHKAGIPRNPRPRTAAGGPLFVKFPV